MFLLFSAHVYAGEIRFKPNGDVLQTEDEFNEAFSRFGLELVPAFTMEVNSAVDVPKLIARFDFYLHIKYMMSWIVDAVTDEAATNYRTYDFEVTYRDDLRILKAFKEPEFKASLSGSEQKVLEKAKGIIKSIITEKMPEKEKALAIHDYLIVNGEYDTRFFDGEDALPAASRLAEGILLNGKGVCMSYASGFSLLAGMAGLECLIVEGFSGGESHAWNRVRIGDTWHNVDVTFDDPLPDVAGRIIRDYFCMPDAKFKKDHTRKVTP